jgi:MFS family permease
MRVGVLSGRAVRRSRRVTRVTPPTQPQSAGERFSPWAPLRHRVFAFLFAAQLGSNIGSFFQVVAASWLMGDLSSSPTLVALIQTASLMPVLLLGFVAGALADIVDRRRLLIAAQAWMVTCAGVLATLTALDLVTPAVLLAMTFAMGTGGALMGPAWQAIQPDLVPAHEFTQAVALSSVTFNTGRTIGPALGGALVAAAGPAWAFGVNAVSFLGVLAVLVGWRPDSGAVRLSRESLSGALRIGWRYSANAPALRGVLIRTAAFAPAAAAIQALLPTVVRDRLGLGSGAFGLLLGCFGSGAVVAALLRPRLDAALSRDQIVTSASIIVAAAMVVTGAIGSVWVIGPALFVAGGAWTSATVTLNVSAQQVLPWWVRARGLGVYMVVLAGGIAIGSAVWGAIAAWSLAGAFIAAAATLTAGTLTMRRWHLDVGDRLDLRPATPTSPMVRFEPEPGAGPVLVTASYRVPVERHVEFVTMMSQVERDRRRNGASDWGLFRDLADTDLFLETFVVDTWAEHVRQHQRRTVTADVMMQRTREFVEGDVTVAHLLSAYAPRAVGSTD